MASPYTNGTTSALVYGPGGTDHLSSMPSADAYVIDWVNYSAGSAPVDVNYGPMEIAVTATGTITVYAISSEDGTEITDGITSSDITAPNNVAAKLKTAPIACVIATASGTVYTPPFSLAAVLGVQIIPRYVGIVVLNSSGAAIAATGNAAQKTVTNFA